MWALGCWDEIFFLFAFFMITWFYFGDRRAIIDLLLGDYGRSYTHSGSEGGGTGNYVLAHGIWQVYELLRCFS